MYSDEIKTKALNLHANDVSAAEICKNLGIARSTLFLWIKQSKPDYRGAVPRKEYLEKTELERLRVENRIFRTCGCTPASPLSEKLEAIDRHKKQFNVYRLRLPYTPLSRSKEANPLSINMLAPLFLLVKQNKILGLLCNSYRIRNNIVKHVYFVFTDMPS